ncbi:hypothetical protein [Kutzneria kofuensis]|uniref:Uncharacterized protein n=1 Tax=Kutzneria kofuensis TaxID=103725 RepID=A0A7W9KEW6_9PSEU|nr:hypothetical protein [Kutzneria kofuensis]MBB5891313.1 hypothetical protein [Kutzneria kofuensis]
MNEIPELPERRRMPEALRDRMWAEIEPRLEAPSRFKAMRAPLAVAASVVVLALGVVFALPLLRGRDATPAAGGSEAQLVQQCLAAASNVPNAGRWRPGARLNLDADHGFLMIRDDKTAAACVIENGKATGVIGNEIGQDDRYGKLTPGRPFDYLTSMNYETESIHFGIAAADVAAVVLVAPDNSDSPGVLRDGTFIVRTKVPENSNQVTTNYVRATLTNGHDVTGPLRPN